MANDLRSFGKRMKRRASNVERNVNTVARKVCIVLHRELVLATPVDTGTARSNWIVSLGSPANGTRKAYKPHPKGSGAGIGESANASAALEAGAAVIARRKAGQSLFVSNNLPYIQRLDEGHSAQAPANFVKRAILQANALLKKIKVLN